ncbi:MAG: pyrroline-5-carboxylate reductase family protein, partial [Suipraeoptans sp.]
GVLTAECITVNDPVVARRDYLTATYDITTVADVTEAAKKAAIVIIAVTPVHIPVVTKVLKPLINPQTVVLSIAAGITVDTLTEQLGNDKKIVRVVPNTLGQSGYGYSAYYLNELCSEQDKCDVEELLRALGQLMPITENMFNMFSSFSNVGPMWLYKTLEALIDAGVHIGLNRDNARNIVLMNMLGVATVLNETGEHPAVKVDQMASPGGVTIEACKTLQEHGFSPAIMNSVSACFDKTNSLE